MRWWVRALLALVVLVVLAVLVAWWLYQRQGLSPSELASAGIGRVEMDDRGVPTIEAPTWEKVVEAQGYVVAADRMFHMDCLRRAGAGRLAELFGARLIDFDRARRKEDWLGAADAAYSALPANEKALADAYARGVNAFLDEHSGRAGLEYLLLRLVPERWQGRDTMLVLLLMNEQLASAAASEAVRGRWNKALPPDWFEFLHPTDHPWNEPLFGKSPHKGPVLPQGKLPLVKLDPTELGAASEPRDQMVGELAALGIPVPHAPGAGASNSWAYCDGDRCYLANDPHLGASVPQLWYAMRLRTSAEQWMVGVAIPGIPGLVLGMNPYLAWAFTNVGEDVDDYLREAVSDDGKSYVVEMVDGKPVWAPIEERTSDILVRDGETVKVTGRFTRRGPLDRREHLGPELWSRQWLPLTPGALRVPMGLALAKSWPELDAAVDEFRSPAQNVVMVDRKGNIAYRASGTGVMRRVTGRLPQSAADGEWQGMLPSSTRARRLIAATGTTATARRFLATANERMWVDEFGHKWAEDLRKDRIRTVLSQDRGLTHDDMVALQLDTHARYQHLVAQWVAQHADAKSDEVRAAVARWKAWSGTAVDDPDSMTDAIALEEAFVDACIGRVRGQLLRPTDRDLPYKARLDSAWVITVVELPQGVSVFGFDERELATALAEKIVRRRPRPYWVENRWRAQHPLVAVPRVGELFKIAEPNQYGWSSVPRVEAPKFGASTRMVWDLSEPLKSSWSFPVGQSGHPNSPHYRDFQDDYHAGRPTAVFDPRFEWWFDARGNRI